MNAKDLLEKVLTDAGYYALRNDDNECGCRVGNLCWCGDMANDACVPAYWHNCSYDKCECEGGIAIDVDADGKDCPFCCVGKLVRVGKGTK